MQSNLEKYKKHLEMLITKGELLYIAMKYECSSEEEKMSFDEEDNNLLKRLPRFSDEYQAWYSEAKLLVKLLLPDRLSDFVRYYEKPKTRKELTVENYRIEDYLHGLTVTRGWPDEEIVGPKAATPLFQQQLAILKSVSARFESSLFDINQLVQADIFDSELDVARELIKHGFLRAAGAIAGVVLEKHLEQVASNHNLKTRKNNPTISDFNDLLKKGEVLDVPSWRKIQRLGDIRNLCDHNKDREPTKEEVEELVDGVDKFAKNLF